MPCHQPLLQCQQNQGTGHRLQEAGLSIHSGGSGGTEREMIGRLKFLAVNITVNLL